MTKPSFQTARDTNQDVSAEETHRSPLAHLVSAHLRARGMRQIDFCRQTGFDQGLLSKILSSVVSTLNVESALRLAEGLDIPPALVFEVIGKKDVDELLRKFYSQTDTTGPLM